MMSAPTVLKTSWSLLITGISASITRNTQDPSRAGRGNEWGRGPESASFLLSPALSSGAGTHWTPPATCPLPTGHAPRRRRRKTDAAGSCSSGEGTAGPTASERLYRAGGSPTWREGCLGLGCCQKNRERGPESQKEEIHLYLSARQSKCENVG